MENSDKYSDLDLPEFDEPHDEIVRAPAHLDRDDAAAEIFRLLKLRNLKACSRMYKTARFWFVRAERKS